MNELTILNEEQIEAMIYEVRGKQVMLDSDLARLYNVETKRINEAVRNNPLKFPERFSWILTDNEYSNLRSKFSTLSLKTHGGRRYNPRVFTEQGVAMLATILKSSTAIKVSVAIMDAFVAMRKYISSNLIEQKYINDLVLSDNKRLNILETSFAKFEEKRKVNEIYFDGQIYDAYSKLVDIMKEAKKELIIIDGYADKSVLDMISNVKVNVKLIAKTKSLIKKIDLEKYNEQYNNLKITYDDTFHDRYIIIDRDIIYHCGTSLNYAGSRTFSINILEDELVKTSLIDKISGML